MVVAAAAPCLATGQVIDLSVLQALSCTYQGGADGCTRVGLALDAINWLVSKTSALCSRSAIPYTSGSTGPALECSDNTKCAGSLELQVGGMLEAPGDEHRLSIKQLHTQPVVATCSTTAAPWRLYAGGILSLCSSEDTADQAMLVVGYGAESISGKLLPVDFIKVCSAWGANWGENGGVRLQYNRGTSPAVCAATSHLTHPALQLTNAAVVGASPTPTLDARHANGVDEGVRQHMTDALTFTPNDIAYSRFL
ncbi:hypothetical protein SDRG_12744 [Saprolegnia diclina VS20]|uniref:Peptidase C1A papain C-terminal domain-containing protein n=1 Tax=Saprolegnia diclina (strain VS20) TaxID=1156394 RepID=T0Q4J3_SAPDV|nr:hypothetical protein SDRG_12744 [Saprolegnia diclina VS20]EQC29496.1 hypothetical protein SDRG_12744 [Saprolegnia diclina VS20]|eukprot:XP_008617048.1 hypothetical protein SDRG_12744 [Saprolegnia diclina VS20]